MLKIEFAMLIAPALKGVRRPLVLGLVATGIVGALASCALLGGAANLPAGIASGNGRLEARQIDIIARYPGRLLDIRVEEGDVVEAGQVLAVLDTRELEAALRAAEARVARARQGRVVSAANIAQSRSALSLASIELRRAETLHHRGFAPDQFLDQRRTSQQSATAALAAAQGGLSAADADMAAASAEADRIREQIAEATLRAPKSGRVLYRLAETGELVGAGGPVVTMLDLSDVYMTIFLPTREAGELGVGAEARIVLDATEEEALPARVSFVSPEAQFTPRQVETRTEREALMYRVRVRLPQSLVARRLATIRTGVTGVAYVRLDPDAEWPARLAPIPTGD